MDSCDTLYRMKSDEKSTRFNFKKSCQANKVMMRPLGLYTQFQSLQRGYRSSKKKQNSKHHGLLKVAFSIQNSVFVCTYTNGAKEFKTITYKIY